MNCVCCNEPCNSNCCTKIKCVLYEQLYYGNCEMCGNYKYTPIRAMRSKFCDQKCYDQYLDKNNFMWEEDGYKCKRPKL